ncbi:MAG: hypothetical protein K5641_00355 [Lachnospiraceae bacterium]|nr:hypothetical protein [Lachnospiraceae bacterium]
MEDHSVILIMDNESAKAEYACAQSDLHECILAGSLKEAKNLCKKTCPILIFLFDTLNSDDPLDVLSELQDDSDLSDIPIVMIMDHKPERSEEMQIYGAGASKILVRPFTKETFSNLVSELTRKKTGCYIDEDAAIAYCGAYDVFKEVATTFITIWPSDRAKIAAACEREDLKDYTIRVHALKNAAKVVGALRLSEEAARMEQSGKAGAFGKIEAYTPALLALFDKSAEELKGIVT